VDLLIFVEGENTSFGSTTCMSAVATETRDWPKPQSPPPYLTGRPATDSFDWLQPKPPDLNMFLDR
jgi:hypothetical protein